MRFHCIKIRYSIEPRDKIYVQGMDFCVLQEIMGKNISNKYGSVKKSTADAIKTASKRSIQKTAEATFKWSELFIFFHVQ